LEAKSESVERVEVMFGEARRTGSRAQARYGAVPIGPAASTSKG
jgi:hypothetical protein